MADDPDFAINLMRMIAAELHFANAVSVSREMFGRSYFSLGVAERIAVDQAVLGHVSANYSAITPAYLAEQQAKQPMGFPIQGAMPTQGSTQ